MNIAVILAGGIGKRMNHSTPKQFLKIKNEPMIFYVLETYLNLKEIDKILIICQKNRNNYLKKLIQKNHYSLNKIFFMEPAETRQNSSFEALKFCKVNLNSKDNDIIIIQDAARPFTEKNVIKNCITKTKKYKAVVATVPGTETFLEINSKQFIKNIFPKGDIFSGKCPEVFQWKTLYQAHQKALKNKIKDYHNNYGLVLQNHQSVKIVEGSYEDIKITTPFDIKIALKILKEKNDKSS